MEGINREYVTRIHNYIIAMIYFEGLLDKGEITIQEYIEIERRVAFKYKLEESIFRMKKRAFDCGSFIEIIKL